MTDFAVGLADALDPLVLALDVGSTGTRGGLFDARGLPVAGRRYKVRHAFTTATDGTSVIDPAQVLDEAEQVLDRVAAADVAGRVAGVALDTFASSLVGVDGAGQPLTPCFTYADSRNAAQATALRAELDEAQVQQLTGCRIHTSYLPARLRWLRETQPEVTARVAELTSRRPGGRPGSGATAPTTGTPARWATPPARWVSSRGRVADATTTTPSTPLPASASEASWSASTRSTGPRSARGSSPSCPPCASVPGARSGAGSSISRSAADQPSPSRRATARPGAACSSAGIRPCSGTPTAAMPVGHWRRADTSTPGRSSAARACSTRESSTSASSSSPPHRSQRPQRQPSGSSGSESWARRNAIRHSPAPSPTYSTIACCSRPRASSTRA